MLWLIGKFPESCRQQVAMLTAVEETLPTGYGNMMAELTKISAQPAPTRINVVEPDYVPGLDLGTVTSRFYGQDQPETLTPRKEFGTQTGVCVCVCVTYSRCCSG